MSDRARDRLVAEVDRRLRALVGRQLAEARRILEAVRANGSIKDRTP